MGQILVVEDDGFTRMLLRSQLRELGHEIIGDVGTSAEAMMLIRSSRPTLVILDLDLGPGPSGVDVAYAVRKFVPSSGILVLSTYVDIRLMGDFRPLPPGAVFMVKRSLSDVSTLEAAMAAATDRELAQEIHRLQQTQRLRRLRDGQVEIMRLVASGLSNAEIAKARGIEEASVAKAVARLISQLDLSSTHARSPRVLITQAYFGFVAGAMPTRIGTSTS